MIIYRRGLSFSPDSWAYWQGSVSLLAGDGYRDLFGLPITFLGLAMLFVSAYGWSFAKYE